MLPTPEKGLATTVGLNLPRASCELRKEHVALRALAELHEPRLDAWIGAAIPDAVQLSALDGTEHSVKFLGCARLLRDEAMLIAGWVVADGEEIGRFCARHVTERAAAVFDVEVAGDVSRVRALLTHFTPPNGSAFSCRRALAANAETPEALAYYQTHMSATR